MFQGLMILLLIKLLRFLYLYINIKYLFSIWFKTFKERILFEDLLSVPGIAPKTGIQIMKERIKTILNLLLNGDSKVLAHLPGLGIKSAKQMIFELQNKYMKITTNKKTKKQKDNSGICLHIEVSEIISTLKTWSFNKRQLNSTIHLVKSNKNIEIIVEEAIKLISNAKQENA